MHSSFPKFSISDLPQWTGDVGPLECIGISEINHNVKSFAFKSLVPAYFDFYPGQHITLILPIFGEVIFRTYTISSSPTSPYFFTVTTKRMPNGVVTNWMHSVLKVGDQIEAMTIGGSFSPALTQSQRPLLLLSGGSGITPMLSTARYLYGHGLPWDTVFMHSAQTQEDFIELDNMQFIESYLETFRCVWIADNGDLDEAWQGPSGFLSLAMLQQQVPDFKQREIFCCGPSGYMDNVQHILAEAGYDMNRYHQESFEFGQSSAAAKEVDLATPTTLDEGVEEPVIDTQAEFTVNLTQSEKVISVSPEANLLEEIRKAGTQVSFACSEGICGTCRTLKLDGEVDMQHKGGLLKRHEDQGYILICCSKAKSDLSLQI